MKSYISRKFPLETRITLPILELGFRVVIEPDFPLLPHVPIASRFRAGGVYPLLLPGACRSARQITVADFVVRRRAVPHASLGIGKEFPDGVFGMRERIFHDFSGLGIEPAH